MIKKTLDDKPVPATVAAKVLEAIQPIPSQLNMTIVWQALIAAILGGVVAYFQYMTAVAIHDQTLKTVATANDVKSTLANSTLKTTETVEEIKVVVDKVHILTNSGMGVQLQLTYDLSVFKANQTKDPLDIEAARLAKEKLDKHNEQQRKVDEETKKGASGPLSLFESAVAKDAYVRGLIEGRKESEK